MAKETKKSSSTSTKATTPQKTSTATSQKTAAKPSSTNTRAATSAALSNDAKNKNARVAAAKANTKQTSSSKADTKSSMAETAREATARRQLASVGLGDKEWATLKEKYGNNAADLVSAAMYPKNVSDALNTPFQKSRGTINSFISGNLSKDQIGKVTGKEVAPIKSPDRQATKQALKAQKVEADKKKTTEVQKAKDGNTKPAKNEPKQETKQAMQAQRQQAATPQPQQTKPASRQQATTAQNTGNGQTFTPSNVRQKIVQQGGGNRITFGSSLTDGKGNVIPELAGATKGSIIDFAQEREVRNEKDPVGTVPNGKDKKYWGVIQCNGEAVNNLALYSLTNPKYKKYADKFFNPGYEKALKEFNDYVDKNEKLQASGKTKKDARKVAYWEPSKQRDELLKYRKSKADFKKNFANEGKNNQTEFLQFQRDFACDIYASQNKTNYKRIETALKKKGMKPEDVNPAVWGMVMSSNIHYQSKSGNIAAIFERKDVDQKFINSTNMVDAIANADPSTFKVGTGKDEVKLAKARIHEKNSATTCRELAMIFDNPRIEQDYLNDMAQNVVRQADGTYLAKAQQPTKTASNNVRTNNTARM